MTIHLANHVESLAFVGLFTLFLSLERQHKPLFWISLFWILAIKQDFSIYMALFGASLFLEPDPQRRRLALPTILISIAWGVFALLIMHLSGRSAYAAAGIGATHRFADLGSSPGEILLHILTHPFEFLGRIFARKPLWILFASVGFFCLLDWRAVWIGIVGAAVYLVIPDPLIGNLHYYYSYAAIPFFFYSAVRGVKSLTDRFSQQWPALPKVLAAWLFLIALFSLPQRTWTDHHRHVPFRVTPHQRLAREIIRLIPPDAAVAAQYDLYAKVPPRRTLLPLRDYNLSRVGILLIDNKGHAPDLTREQIANIRTALDSPQWEQVAARNGYLLYTRASK
jgi:uncharacterized membrane protein